MLKVNYGNNLKDNQYDLFLFGHNQYFDGLGRIIYAIQPFLEKEKKVFQTHRDVANPISLLTGLEFNHSINFYPIHIDHTNSNTMFQTTRKRSQRFDTLSMLESDSIPSNWVNTINKLFDNVYVPSDFLVDAFMRSGVKRPIKKLSLPISHICNSYKSTDKKDSNVFVFGVNSTIQQRKGILETIQCFKKTFGNRPDVQLKIHTKYVFEQCRHTYFRQIMQEIYDSMNIVLVESILSNEELDNFYNSLDAYILYSYGEGFSYTPREVMARGIPTIVSSCAAHLELEKYGALVVDFEKLIPAFYDLHLFDRNENTNFWKSSDKSLCDKMQEVFDNHKEIKAKMNLLRYQMLQYDTELWLNRNFEIFDLSNKIIDKSVTIIIGKPIDFPFTGILPFTKDTEIVYTYSNNSEMIYKCISKYYNHKSINLFDVNTNKWITI